MILLLMNKAEIISIDPRREIRTPKKSFSWPTVIRIKKYVSVPYKRVVLSRKNILRRDSYKCSYCGRGDLPLTVDHVIPKAKGGDDSWENLVTACTYCNNKKGDRTPNESGLHLRIKPYTPSHILFIKNAVGKIDENWKPYLYLS
ncbi:MAG: HNH endonuclease [Chlorobiaceae bacterium]|nr:HNH endonuclease [Chlorobiaceae bacterium]MBA4308734.1 HNH endonuclease [Chlorobiaceae bacterium]